MKKSGFTLIELLVVLAIVCLLAAIIFGSVGGCTVSDGDRVGTISQISHKGVVFTKTWEGQMIMGGINDGVANIWHFSVRNDNTNQAKLVTMLQMANANNQRVHVKYHQRLGFLPWYAGTPYDVLSVQILTNKP